MVTYEITATVREDLTSAYERYMLEQHIPDLLATGAFAAATFGRSSPGRYRVRYEASSRGALDDYLAAHAPRLRAHLLARFPEGVELAREEWAVLDRQEVAPRPSHATAYTHAEWRVKAGAEVAFVEAWRELARAFSALPRPPLWGALLRSDTEPGLYYSFGPWPSFDDIAAMRADPAAQAGLARVRAHCERATPGGYSLVEHVDVARTSGAMRLEHLAIWTHDLERLRAFYERHFGARAGARYASRTRPGFVSYFLELPDGGARLELMTQPGLEVPSGGERAGYAHIALAVGSPAAVDAMVARLQRDGVPVRSAPRRTGDGYYEAVVADPDGNAIEITA